MENLVIQSKGRGELASKDPKKGWQDCDMDFLLMQASITRKVIQATGDKIHSLELFEDEAVISQLKAGNIVYMPMIMFRAVIGEEVCPLCGATFEAGMGSLSRKDNETVICSDCGTREAFEDYITVKK